MKPNIEQVELSAKAREKTFRMLSSEMLKHKVKNFEGNLYRNPNGGVYILKTENHREKEEILIVFQVFEKKAEVITQKHLHGQDFDHLQQVNV